MALTGYLPLTVTFTNGSSPVDEITYWSWSFGEGTTYDGQTPPDVIYDTAGIYDVTLNISSEKGSDTFTDTVTVEEPVAIVSGVITGDGVPVPFAGFSIMELPATVLVTGFADANGAYNTVAPDGHTCWTRGWTQDPYFLADSSGYTTELYVTNTADVDIDVP